MIHDDDSPSAKQLGLSIKAACHQEPANSADKQYCYTETTDKKATPDDTKENDCHKKTDSTATFDACMNGQ
jgi:hypothetical protein